jgi:hypothetical protein
MNPIISATNFSEPEASLPQSATGQQCSHLDKALRVTLRLGEQTGSNALVQTFNGRDFPLRLVECRPYHRLGDGTQEAGVVRRTALRPSEEPRSRTVTGRLWAGNGMFATASSTQSWRAWIEDRCAVECRS